MNKEEMIAFINANPACHIATIEDGQPRVRGILIYKATNDGIIFHTGDFKSFHKQLEQNPKIEICFNNFQSGIQLRVAGKVELLKDELLKTEIVNHPSRAFLKPWVEKSGMDMLAVYKLYEGEACTWTMGTNFEVTKYIKLF